MVRLKSFGAVCSGDECRNYEQNWGASLRLLRKRQRVLFFVEPWSRRALVFVREGLCDWGTSIFVKLAITTCLSCFVISFCLYLHLPKGYVKRCTTSPTYTKQIRSHRRLCWKQGCQDRSQQDRCTLATLSEALKKFGLVPWPVGPLAFKDVGRAVLFGFYVMSVLLFPSSFLSVFSPFCFVLLFVASQCHAESSCCFQTCNRNSVCRLVV